VADIFRHHGVAYRFLHVLPDGFHRIGHYGYPT
jgi:hypothetical protein